MNVDIEFSLFLRVDSKGFFDEYGLVFSGHLIVIYLANWNLLCNLGHCNQGQIHFKFLR